MQVIDSNLFSKIVDNAYAKFEETVVEYSDKLAS